MELREFRNFPLKIQEQRSQLFLDAFPETKSESVSSNEHYQWKFKKFPASPSAYEYAAVKENTLLGSYSALPYRYFWKDQVFTAGMVCDVMTSSKARGQGVFTRIGAFATDHMKEKGLDFTTGYPIRPEVIPGHLKVGWEIYFKLPLYVKLLSFSFLAKFFGGNGLANFFQKISRSWLTVREKLCFSHSHDLKRGWRLQWHSPEDFFLENSLETVIQKSKDRGLLTLDRSKDFVLWRTSAPETKYHILSFHVKMELKAFVVARSVSLKGIQTWALLDFFAPEISNSELCRLHFEIQKKGVLQGCSLIGVMTNSSSAKELRFLRNYYFPTPEVFRLIVKALSPSFQSASLKDEKNWRLFWIDSDDL